jgi:hypothetical protein
MSTPILAHPPFDAEDVKIEAFAAGWDAGAFILGNVAAQYHSPRPGLWQAYERGMSLALDTPFTFGLSDLEEWVKTTASRRRKLRGVR